jgi:hypothetical protein
MTFVTARAAWRCSPRSVGPHRELEDQRQQVAEKEAAARRATEAQVLEDAERLIAAWNERQAPLSFGGLYGERDQ